MITYVLKMYPRFSETFILSEILELERQGEKIEIVSLKKPNDGRFHADLSRVAARVRYLPERALGHPWRYLASHLRALRRRPRAYLATLVTALRLLPHSFDGFLRAPLVAEALTRDESRGLHAHFASLPAITTMFVSGLTGLPFTFTAHAKDLYHRDRSPRVLRTLVARATRVVTVSDFNARFIRRVAGLDTVSPRVVRIYNHVDTTRFLPLPEGSGREVPAAPQLLAVGRLVEKKGFADLIEACAILRDGGIRFHCAIVGKGALHRQLAQRIEALDLKELVSLRGPMPREALAELLPRAAVLAAPCIVGADGNRDGLPTVILEAMSCAVPVVATPVTGIPEAIEDGRTGLLVPSADPGALAAALERLLVDPAFRRRLGVAARDRCTADFDTGANVSKLRRLLAQAHDPAAANQSTGAAELAREVAR